jgi:Flp pilus assembly protein TadD/cell division protein FtsN
MRKNTAIRLAASSLAIGLTTVGCTPAGHRAATVSAQAPKAEKEAHKAYEASFAAVRNGDLAGALSQIESAVELAPRDVAYRMVLADLYLKNGRLLSAEQAYGDALTLNPGNPKAALSKALMQVAQGRNAEAVLSLDGLTDIAAPGDLGLAYALAGQHDRAIAMLEPLARSDQADGRVRQNLALAYALAGHWAKARSLAAQDVSPAELGARLEQWAVLAQPQAPHSQVAALFGIANVVADGGQPTALALAPEAPAPAPPAAADGAVQVASAEIGINETEVPASAYAEASVPSAPDQLIPESFRLDAAASAASPALVSKVQVAHAIETLVTSEAAVVPAVAETPLPKFAPARERLSLEPVAAKKKSTGRFVVQIGAFKTAGQAERAWVEAEKRYSLAGREPLSTTVDIKGKGHFHRLSVAGFDSNSEAQKFCGSIKAKGGACFVRTTAGDSPVQWASRDGRHGG